MADISMTMHHWDLLAIQAPSAGEGVSLSMVHSQISMNLSNIKLLQHYQESLHLRVFLSTSGLLTCLNVQEWPTYTPLMDPLKGLPQLSGPAYRRKESRRVTHLSAPNLCFDTSVASVTSLLLQNAGMFCDHREGEANNKCIAYCTPSWWTGSTVGAAKSLRTCIGVRKHHQTRSTSPTQPGSVTPTSHLSPTRTPQLWSTPSCPMLNLKYHQISTFGEERTSKLPYLPPGPLLESPAAPSQSPTAGSSLVDIRRTQAESPTDQILHTDGPDAQGETVLHKAARSKAYDCTGLLAVCGADYSTRNNDGLTASQLLEVLHNQGIDAPDNKSISNTQLPPALHHISSNGYYGYQSVHKNNNTDDTMDSEDSPPPCLIRCECQTPNCNGDHSANNGHFCEANFNGFPAETNGRKRSMQESTPYLNGDSVKKMRHEAMPATPRWKCHRELLRSPQNWLEVTHSSPSTECQEELLLKGTHGCDLFSLMRHDDL